MNKGWKELSVIRMGKKASYSNYMISQLCEELSLTFSNYYLFETLRDCDVDIVDFCIEEKIDINWKSLDWVTERLYLIEFFPTVFEDLSKEQTHDKVFNSGHFELKQKINLLWLGYGYDIDTVMKMSEWKMGRKIKKETNNAIWYPGLFQKLYDDYPTLIHRKK
jgi:hypothetical protein